MELYWKQRKVYLYGLFVLFPDRLTDEETEQLERIAGRTPTEANRHKFLLELTEYLEKYERYELRTDKSVKPEQFVSQQQKLIRVVRSGLDEYGHRPVVTLTDIWQDHPDRSPLRATFWELILTEQFRTNNITILNMGYEGTYKDVDGVVNPLPFAEFEVRIGTMFQRATAPPKLQKASSAAPIKQRARLIMPDHFIFAELGNGERYQINKQSLRTDLAPYSLMKQLTKHPTLPITLKSASKLYGCEDVRNLGEIIRQCGFGVGKKELFFEVSSAKKVKLKEDVYLTAEEVELLKK